jgi:hypothetical protein
MKKIEEVEPEPEMERGITPAPGANRPGRFGVIVNNSKDQVEDFKV